jgi:hypothetical protein
MGQPGRDIFCSAGVLENDFILAAAWDFAG